MSRSASSRRSRRLWKAVGASAMPSLLFSDPASAATTGRIYEATLRLNNGALINACSEATINDIGSSGQGAGTNWSLNPDSTNRTCTGGVNAPAGYLQIFEWTFKEGSICNDDATSNSGPASGISLFTTCSDPSGSQQWRSWAQASWYKGQYCNDACSGGYYYGQIRESPNLFF